MSRVGISPHAVPCPVQLGVAWHLIVRTTTLVSTPSGVQRPLNLGTSRLPPANVNIPQSLGYAFELPDRHRKPFVTLAACEAVAPAVQDALQVIPKGRGQVDGLGQLALTPVGGR